MCQIEKVLLDSKNKIVQQQFRTIHQPKRVLIIQHQFRIVSTDKNTRLILWFLVTRKIKESHSGSENTKEITTWKMISSVTHVTQNLE